MLHSLAYQKASLRAQVRPAILLVDSDADTALLYKELLEKTGVSIVCTGSKDEAITQLQKLPIKFVVVDLDSVVQPVFSNAFLSLCVWYSVWLH